MIGVGAVTFAGLVLAGFSLYMFFKLAELSGMQHFFLQLLMLAFVMSGLGVAGNGVLEDSRSCEWLLDDIDETGGTSDHSYVYTCLEEPSRTAEIFSSAVSWFNRGLVLYMFFYLLFSLLDYLGKLPSMFNNNSRGRGQSQRDNNNSRGGGF